MTPKTIMNCQALQGVPATLTETPVDIVLHGKRIANIRPAGAASPEGDVIDGTNLLVTAGLINGHNHSHENFQKGRHENMPLEVWNHLVRPLRPLPLTPRDVYVRTMIGAIESLRSGTTTIVDDLIVGPLLNREHVHAALQAYEDIGIRALMAPGLNDLPTYDTVPGAREAMPADILKEMEDAPKTPLAEIMGFFRELAAARHPASQRVAMAVSPSAPQRCSKEQLLAIRQIADDFDLPIIIHVHETRLQAVTGQMFYGATMVEYLNSVGFLRPGVSLIHGVWLTPRDIDILAETGATLQHNPVGNFSLGSGLCPVRELLKAGVNVSLGTDSCASSFTVSMLKTLNATALANNIRGGEPDDWITAAEAFHAATVAGADSLGYGSDLGAVAVGQIADLALWRLDGVAFTPLGDPLRQLVYSETGSGLDTMIIDGDVVISGGNLTRIDEAAILAEARETYLTLKPHIDAQEKRLKPVQDAYKHIYHQCLEHDIPADTHPARFP